MVELSFKEQRKQAKIEARSRFINPYKVGDILHHSWGYDQTNCDFYQVESIETTLNKAARVALVVLVQNSGHKIDTKTLAEITGITLRSAQRDMHEAYNVNIRLAELLKRLKNPPEKKNFTVKEAAKLLSLNEYHIRLLANTLHVGHKVGGDWSFSHEDIESIKNRPHARHHVQHQNLGQT